MPKRMYYRSAFGVWLTDHDIQRYTPSDEKRNYTIFAVAMAFGAVVFFLLGILGAPNILGAWGWYMLTLVCLGCLLAFVPMVLKPERPLADISQELRIPVDPDRAEGFWYERDVADTTFPEEYQEPRLEESNNQEKSRD